MRYILNDEVSLNMSYVVSLLAVETAKQSILMEVQLGNISGLVNRYVPGSSKIGFNLEL